MQLTSPTGGEGISIDNELAQAILDLLQEAQQSGEFEKGSVVRRVGFDTLKGELGGLLRVTEDAFVLFVGPTFTKYEGLLRDLRVQLGLVDDA